MYCGRLIFAADRGILAMTKAQGITLGPPGSQPNQGGS